jgi:GMP synthase-like glutamine amidotransferase
MARGLLIANDETDSGGYVEAELVDRGFELERVHRDESTPSPGLAGAELVVVLGSDRSVHDDANAASVTAEAALVLAAHRRGVPVFAICYGAQILSHALGGTVRRADRTELGWLSVEPLDPAIGSGPWFQWHADTFTIPPGADELARSEVGPQAFRCRRSFGVQFHPEVDAQIVAGWIAADGGRELAAVGVDEAALVEQTRAETVRSETAARALVDWFCRDV